MGSYEKEGSDVKPVSIIPRMNPNKNIFLFIIYISRIIADNC